MEEVRLYVQLAQGSDTKEITHFHSLSDILQQTATLFDVTPEEVLFCTRNTHQVSAESVLGGELLPGDMLFTHVRGETKFISLRKSREFVGITIGDTGSGLTLIKVVHPRSDAFCAGLKPGDVIVSLNGEQLRGLRHFEVAARLRAFPLDALVVFELWRPITNGFSYIAPRLVAAARKQLRADDLTTTRGGRGGAIRFRAADGRAFFCECPHACDSFTLRSLNAVFDSYFGFHDDDLALAVWDFSVGTMCFEEFARRLATSPELGLFNFPTEVVIQLWKATTGH